MVITFLLRSKRLLISWLQSPSAMILEPPKIKSDTVSTASPSVCHEVMGLMPWSSFSECWVLSQLFHSLFHFHQEPLYFRFTFCHKGGVICISEVMDISPGNLDSSLCFIQPSIYMMYSAQKLNKQGDNIQPSHTPFPILNQTAGPCLILNVATWSTYRFLRRQVRWSGIPISWRIFHSLWWCT